MLTWIIGNLFTFLLLKCRHDAQVVIYEIATLCIWFMNNHQYECHMATNESVIVLTFPPTFFEGTSCIQATFSGSTFIIHKVASLH